MAGEVIVDALPYIDHGYDDAGVRESALAMVEEECRRYRPTKNYLDHLTPLTGGSVGGGGNFETKLMTLEFERIHSRQPMETLSMKRYELPPPSAGKLSEIAAWQESIDNSMAQLEHQWVRAMNLELMIDYGIESWRSYLEVFAALQAKAQIKLQQLKKEIQDANWQRKQAQTHAGEKLRTLEANWVLLVSKNYEIEQQCVELEKQLHGEKARIAVQQELLKQEQEQQPMEQEPATEQEEPQVEEPQPEPEQREEENNGSQEEEQSQSPPQSNGHSNDNNNDNNNNNENEDTL